MNGEELLSNDTEERLQEEPTEVDEGADADEYDAVEWIGFI